MQIRHNVGSESGLCFGHMGLGQLLGQPECVLVCVIVASCGLCVFLGVRCLGGVCM